MISNGDIQYGASMLSRLMIATGVFIRNRVHVVTCSFAAVWGWGKLTGTQLLPEDLLTVPLAIACIYSWNRLHDFREDLINSPIAARLAIKSRSAIQSFCMVAVPISLGLSLLRGEKWAVSLLIFVVIIGFLYSTPLSQHSPRKRLKNIFLVKNLISILGWSLLTVVYPAAHSGASINVHHWFAFMVMSATVFIVEIIWDIRDLDGDQQAGIKTIPVELGVTAAIQWVVAINSFSALITLGGLYFGVLPLTWLFVLVNNLLVAVWIWPGGRKILIQRVWSHTLVAFQTVLLICLGLLAVFVDAR